MGNDEAEGDGGNGDNRVFDACGVTSSLVTECTDPIPIAPEEEHVVYLAYASPEEVRQWPRRVHARRESGGRHAVELYLWYPEAPDRDLRHIHFTTEMFERWLDVRGETRDARAVATWGTKTTVNFTFSKIDESNHLVWSPNAADTRQTLDVYNLDPSQPKWRRVLERTLAILPIEHVRAAHLKSIFLDFRVGTSRIGPSSPVGDGGTNWRLSIHRGQPSATRGIAVEGCSAVCATFAALNRAWGQRDVAERALPQTERAIDTSFDNPSFAMFTFYHELGHLLDYGGFTNRVPRRNDLWGRYRDAIDYHGESLGAGEGFAEAYRQRMLGQSFGPRRTRLDTTTTTTTIREMNEAFTSLGIPATTSVNAAWAVIRNHFGGG